MKPERIKKLILTTAATAAAAAAIAVAAAEYENGQTFTPNGADQALNINQIVFPDSDKTTSQGHNNSENSGMLEKDDTSANKDRPRSRDDADYLFENEKNIVPGAQETAGISDENDGGETGSRAPQTASAAGGEQSNAPQTVSTVYDVTRDVGTADVILDRGQTAAGTNGTGIAAAGRGDGTSGAGGGSSNGSGTTRATPAPTANGGAVRPTAQPAPTAVPNPTAQPETPAPTAEPTQQPAADPTATPAPTRRPAPVASDPAADKAMPDYGDDSFTNHKYNEDDISKTDEANRTVRFIVSGEEDNSFYSGQKIDELTIYNAMQTYVMVNFSDIYSWGADDYNKYVRVTAVSFDFGKDGSWITKFPTTIPQGLEYGQMQIKVEYRFRQTDDWTETIVGTGDSWDDFGVEDSRVLILNKELADDAKTIDTSTILLGNQYYALGSTINLLSKVSDYLPSGRLTQLFPGWTEYGLPVSWFYTVEEYGRHVLEPAAGVDFDSDSFCVEVRQHWMSDDFEVIFDTSSPLAKNNVYLQTLTSYDGDTETQPDGGKHLTTLTIPRYIQSIEMGYYPYLSVDTLSLPDTVYYVDGSGVKDIDDGLDYDRGLQVTKSYIVAAGNPRYTAEDGILYNKKQTEILGIPTSRTELTVPAEVTKVVIPYRSSLAQLTLEGDTLDTLPEVNFTQLPHNAVISVNGSLVDDFLVQRRALLASAKLYIADADDPARSYTVKDDYAVTKDGALHRVLTGSPRWLTLPDYVTGIEGGALQSLTNMTTLMLPQDGRAVTFDDGWADGADSLQLIGCYSMTQYDAAKAAAPKGVEVRLMGTQVDGYTYLKNSDGSVVLLAAPATLTGFDGTVPTADGGTLTVTDIGDGAFKGCYNLEWVILPEETTTIGYQAFRGCTSLQGVLINTQESITIAEQAFDECPDLRFVASNAMNGDVADDLALTPVGENEYSFLYCLNGSTGYNGNWICFTDETLARYELVDCGGVKVLYGVDSNGAAWLALRSGGTVDGDAVTFPAATQVIYWYAMQGARNADGEYFTVNWDTLTTLSSLGRGAFASSDLGQDVVLPEEIFCGGAAFQSCQKLRSIELPGSNVILGEDMFNSCANLESVSFGRISYISELRTGMFSGCTSLRDLTFTNETPPQMVLFNYGSPFRFNLTDWPDAESEEQHIRIHVPDDYVMDYMETWRYPFSGYTDVGDRTAYQILWNEVWNEMFYNNGGLDPDADDVTAEVDRRLIDAENHTRRMLGLPDAEETTHKYTYEIEDIDGIGYVTLTEAKNVLTTDLSPEELELPEGWCLDYIGTGAFRESPGLYMVTLRDDLSGIYYDAFDGLQFEGRDPDEDGLLLFVESVTPYELMGFTDGKPFSFGVDDDKIVLLDNTADGVVDKYIQAWTLPMAGYHTISALRAAVSKELTSELGTAPTDEQLAAAVNARLMAAENRIRTMLKDEERYPILTDPANMVFSIEAAEAADGKDTDTGDGGETDLPDLPDLPDEYAQRAPEAAVVSDLPTPTPTATPAAEATPAPTPDPTLEPTATPTATETPQPATPESAAKE